MNCAKVIGKTYSEFKHPSLKGYDFKILQTVDPGTGELTGRPFFAIDPLDRGRAHVGAHPPGHLGLRRP